MYTTIIGDIIGSSVEFSRNRDFNVEIKEHESYFTDDTVLTIAVADWLMDMKDGVCPHDTPFKEYICRWCSKYNDSKLAYGGGFSIWLAEGMPGSRNSFGNGAIMRISSIPFIAANRKEVLEFAERSCLDSHNHPDSIISAKFIALFSHLLKERSYNPQTAYAQACSILGIDSKLFYPGQYKDYSYYAEEVIPTIHQVMHIVLNNNLADPVYCLRKAISLGGDADTIASTVGGIIDAYNTGKIHSSIPYIIRNNLPNDMKNVLHRFDFYRLKHFHKDVTIFENPRMQSFF